MICRFFSLLAGLVLLQTQWPCLMAAEPANPEISPEARKILSYISELKGRYDRRLMLGQSPGLEAGSAQRLFDTLRRSSDREAGQIAILDFDYGVGENSQSVEPSAIRSAQNRHAIAFSKIGGLVSLAYRPTASWIQGAGLPAGSANLRELTDPRSSSHSAWIRELDSVAASLAELRDAGVAILWRPMPDMNGAASWWGHKESEPFDKEGFAGLWRQMFDYLTKTKKLNNLIWVYCASSDDHSKMSASAYFPGTDYCDITAMTSRSPDAVWDGYNEMIHLGKPFGMAGFFPSSGGNGVPDSGKFIGRARLWYPLTTFLLARIDILNLMTPQSARSQADDSWILRRDYLDWKTPGALRWKQTGNLAIQGVEILTKEPAAWKRLDVRIDLTASYDSPFDPGQIEIEGQFTTPTGRIVTIPAFMDQPFERRIWGGGRFSEEVMTEGGPPEWRIRFMPSEPGKYRFTVRARDGSGSVTSPVSSFEAGPGSGRGYIRVSTKDPHYFEFDNGEPFFAIGLNMVEHPLSEYYRYIPRLAENGGNFSRLWIGYDYFALEHGTMGFYRLDNAWRLDQVMELSEKWGIYQKLCIDWIRYITPRGEARRGFDHEDYAYSISNGGPCQNMKDFFTLPEAKRRFKNRLRYLVARWGYSPNVMAWELWNEIDLVDPKALDPSIIVPWNQEMCRYLKSIDPWQHLTTNSLAGKDTSKSYWPLEENQFAQRHGYSTPRPDAVLASADMAGNVIQWLNDVSGFQKPYLMAEFGLQRDRIDVRGVCDRDQEGIHMHAGLWSALAHGSAGTGQLWWWGQYVDPKNLYVQFRAVASFVRGIPWNTAGFERMEPETPNESLRAIGLRGKQISILWLQNTAHTWWNVVNGTVISPVEPVELILPGIPPGRYSIEYWDTYSGKMTRKETASATAGSLKIMTPRLETDIALKIVTQ